LKAAVVIMGVLLIVGFGALVVTIAVKGNRLIAGGTEPPVIASAGGDTGKARSAAPFATTIDLAGPATIQDITAGGGVILIHLTGDSGRKIIVINAETGARQGVITLGKTP